MSRRFASVFRCLDSGRTGVPRWFIVVLVLATSPTVVLAQSTGTIRIKATTPQTEFRIGDLIDYQVAVEWRAPVELLRVEPSDELNQFEIREPKETEKRIGGGWRRRLTHIYLSTFETGDFTIPQFFVVYRDAEGNEKRVPTPPVNVRVNSVALQRPDDEGIRDAKPPVLPPARLTTAQIVAIAAGAVAIITLIAFFVIRALRRRIEEVLAGPVRPIEEVARERLALVAQSDLLERKMIKEYFDQVSDIIREYLGLRYGFQGVATTTSELIEALRGPLSEDGRLDLVAEFSEEADMAKFARWQPDHDICDQFLRTAHRVIDETSPPPLTGPEEEEAEDEGADEEIDEEAVFNVDEEDTLEDREKAEIRE